MKWSTVETCLQITARAVRRSYTCLSILPRVIWLPFISCMLLPAIVNHARILCYYWYISRRYFWAYCIYVNGRIFWIQGNYLYILICKPAGNAYSTIIIYLPVCGSCNIGFKFGLLTHFLCLYEQGIAVVNISLYLTHFWNGFFFRGWSYTVAIMVLVSKKKKKRFPVIAPLTLFKYDKRSMALGMELLSRNEVCYIRFGG